jgi:hypothetical protein
MCPLDQDVPHFQLSKHGYKLQILCLRITSVIEQKPNAGHTVSGQ